MTFQDVLFEVEWEDVWEQIVKHYPKQKNKDGYYNVLQTLFNLTPAENPDGCTIIIDLQQDDVEGGEYYMVAGLENGNRYAIEYCPWEEWLGYYIDKRLLTEMTLPEIVAHCLYEMTWGGFTQEDIKKHVDEIAEEN